jgi:hypothetical protein
MLAVVLSLLVGLVMSDRVLVVNHTAGNVVSVNSTSGELQELVAAGVGGIALPDPIIIHDDIIYIGCGNTYATSAILMYQPDGSFVGRFDRGGVNDKYTRSALNITLVFVCFVLFVVFCVYFWLPNRTAFASVWACLEQRWRVVCHKFSIRSTAGVQLERRFQESYCNR